jgi:hypothetical protein
LASEYIRKKEDGMRGKFLLVIVVFTLLAVPCFAQQKARSCDPTGTWVGGGDPLYPSYQLTVTSEGGGRYTVTYQMMFDPGTQATSFTGEMRRGRGGAYDEQICASLTITQEMADFYASLGVIVEDLSLPELDCVHARTVMVDCDTMQTTIDWFAWYLPFSLDEIPFVTQPEIEVIRDLNGGDPILETYHRIRTDDCPACSAGGKAGLGLVSSGKTLPMPHKR